MTEFKQPYYVTPADELPFHDFNREIVAPGQIDEFPDGAIGIRVDDDFWAVAALPYAEYADKSIQQIVQELWPSIFPTAEFNKDSELTAEDIERAKKMQAILQCSAQ